MAKMKVVQVPKAGADFELVEREIPQPGAGCGLSDARDSKVMRAFGPMSVHLKRLVAPRVSA